MPFVLQIRQVQQRYVNLNVHQVTLTITLLHDASWPHAKCLLSGDPPTPFFVPARKDPVHANHTQRRTHPAEHYLGDPGAVIPRCIGGDPDLRRDQIGDRIAYGGGLVSPMASFGRLCLILTYHPHGLPHELLRISSRTRGGPSKSYNIRTRERITSQEQHGE